jgi:hypothetical protein
MNREQFIKDALSLSPNVIDYHTSEHLADLFPGKALVEGGDGLFNVEEYAQSQQCTFEYKAVVYNQVITHWRGRQMRLPGHIQPILRIGDMMFSGPAEAEQELVDRAKNAWFEVRWQGYTLDVIVMHWTSGMSPIYHYWIIADTEAIAKDFLLEVCRWNADLRGEVLVFEGGCWHKDARLFEEIKDATFDNLILKGTLKQDIQEDLKQFFAARTTYEEYGIPWKRGILFVGPPGNGKTHAVKAIINSMEQRCLYVKSFMAEFGTDQDNIRQVFDRARKSAPCILVLEDLDSLLNAQNRSFFLNELDGFAANIGIVTLATTNHPERLDPSILDRPSRFDRKYPFNLPESEERQAYIAMLNATLKPSLRLSGESALKLAELTEGFSFAYLKELFLSSMMRWIARPEQGTMEQIMTGQVDVLREQMMSVDAQTDKPDGDTPQAEALTNWKSAMGRRSIHIRPPF